MTKKKFFQKLKICHATSPEVYIKENSKWSRYPFEIRVQYIYRDGKRSYQDYFTVYSTHFKDNIEKALRKYKLFVLLWGNSDERDMVLATIAAETGDL